jgi:hypothetical protein
MSNCARRTSPAAPILLGLVLVVCGLALAGGRQAADAREPGVPRPDPAVAQTDGAGATPVFECFDLVNGDNPNLGVRLVTSNFGRQAATVTRSDAMCESANKYEGQTTSGAAPVNGVALQCFDLDAPQSEIGRDFYLDTANFGRTRVTVGSAFAYCENALKIRASVVLQNPLAAAFGLSCIQGLKPGDALSKCFQRFRDLGLIFGDPDAQTAWQCFDAEPQNDNLTKVVTLYSQNWGRQTGRLHEPTVLCEQARKLRTGWPAFGQATGVVYACSRFEQDYSLSGSAWLITRNFGIDSVRVVHPSYSCEPAVKQGIIKIPAGHTLTLQNAQFSACNALRYGYQVDSNAPVSVDTKSYGCFDAGALGVTIGPFGYDVEVRVWLQDQTCGNTNYFSDGDHARVVTMPSGWVVDITDAGGFCEAQTSPRPPGTVGNLHVEAVLSP